MTPKEYLQKLEDLQEVVTKHELLRDTVVIPPFDWLRPMTRHDVREGQVVYGGFRSELKYNIEPHPYWHVVEEVRNPGDAFKAYVADDGCRYGLEDHYVEKE